MKKMCILSISFLFISVLPSFSDQTKTIKIAAIYAQTGIAAEASVDSLESLRLAVKILNNSGGILGKSVELLIFDNGSTPIGSKIAADRAVRAKVIGIIGSLWSSHSLAIAQVAQKNKIPMITNTSTHPDITKTGDYIFRVCFTDAFQGTILAKYVRNELKFSTAAILENLNSDYSMGLSMTFADNFEHLGGKILLHSKYKMNQQDFKDLLEQVKRISPEIIFVPGYNEVGIISKQSSELEMKQIFVGGDGWGIPALIRDGGSLMKRGYYSTHWSKEVNIPLSKAFLQKYPDLIYDEGGILAIDAIMLLADAIKRSQTINPQKIRDALAQTQNYQGLSGTITMDPNRNPIKSAVIMKIENGIRSYVKTIEP